MAAIILSTVHSPNSPRHQGLTEPSPAQTNAQPDPLNVALELLSHHFAEHAAANPAFILKPDWQSVYRTAIEAGLASGRHRMVLALTERDQYKSAVGVCVAWIKPSALTVGHTGIISELFITPTHRGNGVGRILAEDACEWLLASGATDLSLSTPVVGGARPFWERLGFAVTSFGMARFPAK